jgi:hypothetical protein
MINVGTAKGLSLRQWVDSQTNDIVGKHRKRNVAIAEKCKERRAQLEPFTAARAKFYQPG